MNVSDFEGTRDVGTAKELHAVLAKRFAIGSTQANSFELSHEGRSPMMNILIKDDLANVWYTDSDDSAGSNSLGSLATLPEGGGTVFYFFGERQWVANELIVGVPEACQAAQEFLTSGTRPKCIRWFDL